MLLIVDKLVPAGKLTKTSSRHDASCFGDFVEDLVRIIVFDKYAGPVA